MERERLERAKDRMEEQTQRMQEKAREAGRKERDRRLAVLASFFGTHRIALTDLRLLFHPVDYVTFHGLSAGSCTSIELLDREAVSLAHERLQRSIQKALSAGNLAWKTMRIAENGKVTCT